MILSPSLLSADCGRLTEECAALASAGVQWVHWDVMDGSFVPNITFGQHVIRGLRHAPGCERLVFDVHLMIEQPERHIEAFRVAGAERLMIHAETTRHLQRTLTEIRKQGMSPGVALNPATPLAMIEHVLDDVDMVLLMSVNPGFGGQTFIPATRPKIRALRRMLDAHRPGMLIQVDGGVTPDNAAHLLADGADVLVSGSGFFAYPYAEAVRRFTAAAAGGC